MNDMGVLHASAAVCLLAACAAVSGCRDGGVRADFYVSPSGDDSADGMSPSRAFRTIGHVAFAGVPHHWAGP